MAGTFQITARATSRIALRFGVLVGLTACSAALGPIAAKSAEICTAEYFSGCDGMDEACLEKFHACGQYDVIVNHFTAEDLKAAPIEQYYVGAAYFGLFSRTRAKSYRCEYSAASKSNLLSFINSARQKENLNDPNIFRKVRHAVQIVAGLQSGDGCGQESESAEEIAAKAHAYADRSLKSLFLPSGTNGAWADWVRDVNKAINETINGFVNKAAKIETDIVLRSKAIEASDQHLVQVLELYAPKDAGQLRFGDTGAKYDDRNRVAQVSPVPDASSGIVIRAKKISDEVWAIVKAKDEEFQAATGTISLEQYEDTRAKYVGLALLEVAQSTNLLKATDAIFPSNASPDLVQLEERVNAKVDSSVEGSLKRIKSNWSKYQKARGFCHSNEHPWFCAE